MTYSWNFWCGVRLLTGYTFYLVFWGLLGREPGYSSRRRRGVGVKTLGGSAIPCKGITTREAGEQSLISSDKRERTVCTGKGSLANSSGPGGQLHGLLPQANKISHQTNSSRCYLPGPSPHDLRSYGSWSTSTPKSVSSVANLLSQPWAEGNSWKKWF